MMEWIITRNTNLPIIHHRIIIQGKNEPIKKRKSTCILKQIKVLVTYALLSFPSVFFNLMMLPLNFYKSNLLCPQLLDSPITNRNWLFLINNVLN